MNTAKCTYFFIILISISGCKNNNPISDSSAPAILDHEHFEIINIDPQKSILLKTDDFVNSINFIPLETTIDSEFSEISQIASIDDRYIILDKNTSQILFFTKKGKFLKKISPGNDESPNSYKKILYFTIDKYNKKIYFNDLDSFNKFEFDLDGNLLRVYPKEGIDYHIRENHNINEYQLSYFAYRGFQINKEAPSNIKIFKGEALVHAYLPFDATIINREDTYGSSNYFFDSDSLVFFSKPYSYNIYCFDDLGGMARAFQFRFPNQLCIPEDFTTNPLYSKKRKQFIKNNGKKYIWLLIFSKQAKIFYSGWLVEPIRISFYIIYRQDL
ncbi:6-bladed beta-propeller [Parapedobacter sp. 10938]|uniref:6-bladed beta-propeller n=1 Tax=Parapedobacter flavus TaxID=3110225 RepID=UPI002DB65B2C|nr:6-bladed beta-propeller [Parapedobacter sp. 10938]MEC3881176.1 6-bladed beta-propeller [Parapedobacter sp. 10938]